ncbi:MAG: phosphotransferase [Actinomycetota bacterium]|nr:phosphotransferase [Actinomycetota bacterium]
MKTENNEVDPSHDDVVQNARSRATVFERCQAAVPTWDALSVGDVEMDDPKGFSSFTSGIRAQVPADPPAVLYRELAGKENAILAFEQEREVFLMLGEAGIAAECLAYERTHRIEAFYRGRTLTADDVFDPVVQRGVANELFGLHQLQPDGLPDATFFELLTDNWGPLARSTLVDQRSTFPVDEQQMCADLETIYSPETTQKVLACLPGREPVFCHNDTYHGNVFMLNDGTIRLLDFEFSCRNHIAFDFANFFAETAMVHGLADPPHFQITPPRFTHTDLRSFVGFYLDNLKFDSTTARQEELDALVLETRRALMLSDYMYAMAALPLAVKPIQKIRFIPYAHQRFHKFLSSWEAEFGTS